MLARPGNLLREAVVPGHEPRRTQTCDTLIKRYKRYVPGFENVYVVQSWVNVDVRANRGIPGAYKLIAGDVFKARKFDDVIARGSYPIDIHSLEGKGIIIRWLPPGEAYNIPLRNLLPENVENLAVAGRSISGTYEAQTSYRSMPICMATGQAARVCVALVAQMCKSRCAYNRCSKRASTSGS